MPQTQSNRQGAFSVDWNFGRGTESWQTFLPRKSFAPGHCGSNGKLEELQEHFLKKRNRHMSERKRQQVVQEIVWRLPQITRIASL